MDNKIDLDAIAMKFIEARPHHTKFMIARATATEAIRQALVLASEIDPIYDEQGEVSQDKQSILAINDLVV